jgi:hypothetical protein
MFDRVDHPTTADVSLLLRAHAEQHWLSREVIPVLRQIETRERLPEEQLPAALAYLEMIWSEAGSRAWETDAARALLSAGSDSGSSQELALAARASVYGEAVLRLREVVTRRVLPLLAAPFDAGEPSVGERMGAGERAERG